MPDSRKSGLYWDIGQVIVGIIIGIALALPFFLISTDAIVAYIRDNAISVIVFLTFTAAFLLLLLSLRKPITRWALGITMRGPEDLANQAIALAGAVADRDVEAIRQGGKDFALQMAALYGWMAARRMVFALIFTFGGLLAGVMGSALLIQQNRILEAQNRNLDLQLKTSLLPPILQEANRRVPLYSQITAIFARIDAELAAAEPSVEQNFPDSSESAQPKEREPFSPFKLSGRLYSDIVGLSLQLKPYLHFDSRKLDLDGIAEIPEAPEKAFESLVFLSPERGMLLRYLIENRIKLDEGTLDGADFTYSDLRGFRADSRSFADFDTQQKFVNAERFVCFSNSSDGQAETLRIGFRLDYSDLSEAIVSGVTFDPTNVLLSGTNLQHSVLKKGREDVTAFNLESKDASFYDVKLDIPFQETSAIRLSNVAWRGFSSNCLIGDAIDSQDLGDWLKPDRLRFEIFGHVALYPVEVFSDGMWNVAVEEVSEAFDTEVFSLWIPPALSQFFAAHGIKTTILGRPSDYKKGEAVDTPESFGFNIVQ